MSGGGSGEQDPRGPAAPGPGGAGGGGGKRPRAAPGGGTRGGGEGRAGAGGGDVGQIVCTESPNFLCSKLPRHWRTNKAMPSVFRVIALGDVADNTVVSLAASNQNVLSAELRNSVAFVKDQVCCLVLDPSYPPPLLNADLFRFKII